MVQSVRFHRDLHLRLVCSSGRPGPKIPSPHVGVVPVLPGLRQNCCRQSPEFVVPRLKEPAGGRVQERSQSRTRSAARRASTERVPRPAKRTLECERRWATVAFGTASSGAGGTRKVETAPARRAASAQSGRSPGCIGGIGFASGIEARRGRDSRCEARRAARKPGP